MSVLIKGMEMPKSCDDCRLNNGISCYAVPEYTEDGVVGRTDDRPEWCPLVPVPPHGRLIDESEIDLSKYEKAAHDALHNGKGSILYDSGVLAGARAITRLVRNAPTIIPAEPFNNLSKPCKDDNDIPICTKASPASLGIYKKAEEGEW